MGKRIRRAILLLGVWPLLWWCGCGGEVPADLDQAAQVIHHMMQPNFLTHSSFAAACPDPKPSQFVSYIFSEMSTTEWPASEAYADDLEREQMKASGTPMQPLGVAFVPRAVNPQRGRQLVVKFDDFRGMVIVEGYEDPTREPVLVRTWVLPHVEPAPGVRAMFQSSLRAGMSYQAF